MTELKAAISSSKSNTPGPDFIPMAFVKNLNSYNMRQLLDILNYFWKNGLPDQWKIATIIPILKPGKDPTDRSAYRPISLTNCLCKTMERVVKWRLQKYLDINNIIAPYQSGFRPGHSTTDSLIRLENSAHNAILFNEYCLAIFLDIEKAFDTVWHRGLIEKLKNIGLKGKLPRFICYRSLSYC